MSDEFPRIEQGISTIRSSVESHPNGTVVQMEFMIIKSNLDNLPQGPPILYIMSGCDRDLSLYSHNFCDFCSLYRRIRSLHQ